MNVKRPERVADLLLEFVSQLLRREINDPRIGVVTLTRSKISKDLKYARIYFSIFSKNSMKDEVLVGLKSATGFIRARIAKNLRLRFVPALEFVYDDVGENAQRIEQLLEQIKDEDS